MRGGVGLVGWIRVSDGVQVRSAGIGKDGGAGPRRKGQRCRMYCMLRNRPDQRYLRAYRVAHGNTMVVVHGDVCGGTGHDQRMRLAGRSARKPRDQHETGDTCHRERMMANTNHGRITVLQYDQDGQRRWCSFIIDGLGLFMQQQFMPYSLFIQRDDLADHPGPWGLMVASSVAARAISCS